VKFTHSGLFYYSNASFGGHYSAEFNSTNFYNISGSGSYAAVFWYFYCICV
jgi:hypothetical protein